MYKKIISIIVPIYNNEKYLNDLFESIDSQTFNDYELLLINDGSIDDSEKLCKKYIKKNKNAKYFYKENTGVSDTRNYGIDISSGKYICFVDSDDILHKDFLKILYKNLKNNDVDLISCKIYKFINKNELKSINNYNNIEKFSNKYDIIYSPYGGYLCNKIFRKSIIVDNNLKLNNKIHMCEDMLFLCEYLNFCKSIACVNSAYYFYRIFNESSGKKLKNIKWFSIFNSLDEIKKFDIDINKYNYSYYIYLLEAKYRLKYVKKSELYSETKKDISQRYEKIKEIKKTFNGKQKIKIFAYTYFNKISFTLKRKIKSKR